MRFFTTGLFYNVLLVLGVIGIIDTTVLLSYGVGKNLGTLFPGIIGTIFVISGLLYNLFGIDIIKVKRRIVRNILIIVLGFWMVTFLFIEGLILTGARSDENKNSDFVIVLGAALHGKQMSLTLSTRMYKALVYLNAHPNTKVVVSGGQGPGESITEAEAMKRFLVAKGINENRIWKEEKSTSTIENLRFSKAIIEKQTKQTAQIMLTTNDFHMYRAKMLARREGLEVYALPSETPLSVRFNSYFREYFAVIKSYFLDK